MRKRYRQPKGKKQKQQREMAVLRRDLESERQRRQASEGNEAHAQRERYSLHSEVETLRRRLEGYDEKLRQLTEGPMEYFKVCHEPSMDMLTAPMAVWRWEGCIHLGISVDTNHCRMMPRGSREAWEEMMRRRVMADFEKHVRGCLRVVAEG